MCKLILNLHLFLFLSDLQCFQGESLGTMSIDIQRRMLYMGGKNIFYIFDLNNALSDVAFVRNYTWPASGNVIDSCTMKGTQFWECQNYIQVLLYNNVDNKLLVCGTNAQAPRCRYFTVSMICLSVCLSIGLRLSVCLSVIKLCLPYIKITNLYFALVQLQLACPKISPTSQQIVC